MKKGIWALLIAVVLLVALFVLPRYTGSRALDPLAQCIADSGTKFYGTWWCPHCQNQKKLFGRSAELLPYIECSGSNPQGPQLEVCTQAGVEGYPTWVFPDASRLSGEVSLAVLAEKTGCTLPQAE